MYALRYLVLLFLGLMVTKWDCVKKMRLRPKKYETGNDAKFCKSGDIFLYGLGIRDCGFEL